MKITRIDVYRPCPASLYQVEISRGPEFFDIIASDLRFQDAEDIAQDRKRILEANGAVVSLVFDTRGFH